MLSKKQVFFVRFPTSNSITLMKLAILYLWHHLFICTTPFNECKYVLNNKVIFLPEMNKKYFNIKNKNKIF